MSVQLLLISVKVLNLASNLMYQARFGQDMTRGRKEDPIGSSGKEGLEWTRSGYQTESESSEDKMAGRGTE